MDVLGVDRPLEGVPFDLALNLREAALDRRKIALRDDSGGSEHARVGERSGDVLLGETAVQFDRGCEALYALVDRLLESAGPEFRLARHAPISLNIV